MVLGGCANRAAAPREGLAALSAEAVRATAWAYMRDEQGVASDASVAWGSVSLDETTGESRLVAWVAGQMGAGGAGARRYVMDVAPAVGGSTTGGVVVRAWGPREVGGGCTCHDTGEARLR